MNPLVPHRRRRSDTGSISYVVESLPGEDLQSDYEEETQGPSDTRTSKQPRWSKRGATKGYARDQPCQDCFTRMIDNGPENLCSSQAKAGTTACYRCARLGNKCQLLSPHLLDHGARLQSAACRIMNGQPVENWDQLVIATRNALRNDVVAKPKVTPRAQSSKGPASVSAHAFPQVQLRPSRESPPRQGPPEVQDLPQLAAASQSPSDTTLQQILAVLKQNNALLEQSHALSKETNQLLRGIDRQLQEGNEKSQEQIRCHRRIIGEMNAFNEGTDANLSPFR